MLAVSRYHAQVMPEGDSFVLYDRSSANGTVVNGQRVFRHVLSHGDEIQLFGTRLAFSESGDVPSVARWPASPAPLAAAVSVGSEERLDGCVLEEVLGLIKDTCRARTRYVNPFPLGAECEEAYAFAPVEVEVGGAVVFVTAVGQFEIMTP